MKDLGQKRAFQVQESVRSMSGAPNVKKSIGKRMFETEAGAGPIMISDF